MAIDDPDMYHVARVAKGDATSARILVEAHGDRLMAVAYRMLGDRAAAEDVVQETFIRMWRHAHNWKPDKARFSTWLHRVAINLCYDRLRKASTRYEHSAGDDLPDMADERSDAAMAMQKSEQGLALREAMDRLPERQKMAVVLCHYQEVSNRDAAEMMEISVEAIESLLARAMRAMRKDMKLKDALSDSMAAAV